jgi:maltooligosyltrehalose trehalohydrolase
VKVRFFDEDLNRRDDVPLDYKGDGVYAATIENIDSGALYQFVLDGQEVPDPYARCLPFGVDGPARVVKSRRQRALPDSPPLHRWSIYEIHVGTFTPAGTFRGAIEKLDSVAELGVSAIELLPIAAFAGYRGWGYDGVAPFSPFAEYGGPDDLRALVLAAHERGLAVVLDVVYNHFGPSGNYLPRYSKEYFAADVQTPWGAAPDFSRRPMRSLVIENVRYWLTEFGFDALRLDAAHAIVDSSDRHIVAEIVDVARSMDPPRRVFIEDERNHPHFLVKTGVDAVWADDFHHQIHVLLTQERDGYYEAYTPTVAALAKCIREGWTYSGQPYAPWQGRRRGAPVFALRPEQLITCVQNHDQVGNRAFGTRLSHEVGTDRFALAAMVLLFLPTTPLLFMGQEWAATSPFLFFSNHGGELGKAVTAGRRKEFAHFAAFAEPGAAESIPDPEATETYERSKLHWEERESPRHNRVLALHRALLSLRKADAVMSAATGWDEIDAFDRGDVLEIVRTHRHEKRRLIVNFGNDPAPVNVSSRSRVLLLFGDFDGRRIGACQGMLLSD